MKSRISLSKFSLWLTAIIDVAMFAACICTVREPWAFAACLAIYIILIVATLFWGAAYIEATPKQIILGSLLRSKKIPMRRVVSVEPFKPTMGAIRICASGGYVGYWGIFREGDIGRYYGFYGKDSDCFLVRMDNGNKYVLGCKDPASMIAYIQSQIHPAKA